MEEKLNKKRNAQIGGLKASSNPFRKIENLNKLHVEPYTNIYDIEEHSHNSLSFCSSKLDLNDV